MRIFSYCPLKLFIFGHYDFAGRLDSQKAQSGCIPFSDDSTRWLMGKRLLSYYRYGHYLNHDDDSRNKESRICTFSMSVGGQKYEGYRMGSLKVLYEALGSSE